MARKKRNYKVTSQLRTRLMSMRVDRELRNHNIPHTTQSISQVSATTFHKAISAGKSANKKGWMVDVHSVSEYRSMRCYLTADGKSGIAIKRNGDVVSLFSAGGGVSWENCSHLLLLRAVVNLTALEVVCKTCTLPMAREPPDEHHSAKKMHLTTGTERTANPMWLQ